MNPGENNPLNNAGMAGGAVPGSAPLDFTTPAGDSSVNSGLSMADSMAVAQDSLTSAGMAAPDSSNNALGLDQISSLDPMATMAASDQPLVPAAPVPGSIGSVTSVPPLETTPGAADSTTGTTTTPMNPFANTPTATIADGAGGVGSALPADNTAAMLNEPAAQPPYNPFAAQPGAAPATSSMEVPDALQPATEKFSGDGKGQKSKNILAIILGGLAMLFAVTTVIFIVLWIQAKDSGGSSPIIIEPIDEQPVKDTLLLMSCSRDGGVGEGMEFFPEVQSMNYLITANFKNDDLTSIEVANNLSFATVEAAEAMREYFDAEMVGLAEIGNQLGIEPITAEFTIDGSTIVERLAASEDKLVGNYVDVFMLPVTKDGSVDTYIDSVQNNYEANGFVCQVE